MMGFLRTIIISVFVGGLSFSAQAGSKAGLDERLTTDVHCLAQNIYHEARGEPMVGKLAVGHVVLNRMADRRFPRLACSVIKQGGENPRHRCQFSWWCDGRSDRARNREAWQESMVLAYLIRAGITKDPTDGALWYHASYVSPSWARAMKLNVKIGKHIFYADHREKNKVPKESGKRRTRTQVADAGS